VTAPDFDSARAALAGRLSAPAYAHSIRVAETAAAMARAYGADEDSARLGGLLHDWDRELGPDQLLSSAERLGMPVDPVESGRPYLLHAGTGAAALRDTFDDLPHEVVTAVGRHTVGAEEMSELDMIVFVADMIEPSRSFEGVDDLRDRVGEVPLEELFAGAYRRSVMHLVDQGKPIHPDTVKVWNAYVPRWRS